MKLALLIAMSTLTLARADIVAGSLTWTDAASFQGGGTVDGLPNVSFLDVSGESYNAQSDGSIVIRGFCEDDLNPCTGYTLDRAFTVTTPGAFLLSTSAALDLSTSAC